MNFQLHHKVSAFIDYENALLDSLKYEQWLKLWQVEGLYIVPVDLENDDYENQINFAYDNADMRRMRVARLKSGESISAATNGGTIRLTSRLVVQQNDGLVNANCALIINECRLGDLRQFIANVEYQLIEHEHTFNILQKTVKLINAEDYLRTISYLL